jgi:hypothetical protein
MASCRALRRDAFLGVVDGAAGKPLHADLIENDSQIDVSRPLMRLDGTLGQLVSERPLRLDGIEVANRLMKEKVYD